MSDYEFKNTALAKLYEKFMNNGPWLTVKPVDGMLEAFIECDEKLADIQDQCDHWKTMYGNACGDQDVLKESIRLLDNENRRLRQQVSDQEKEINQRRKEADGLYKALDQLQEENEKLKNLHFDVVAVNHKTIDQLQKKNETMKHVIDDFTRFADATNKSKRDAEKEIDELKKDCAYMTNSRDTWRSRAKHAEAEVEELKKKLDLTQHAYNGACKDRNCKAEAVVKLAKRRDELQEKNEELQQRLMDTTDILEKTNRDRNEWKRRALMTKLTSKVPDIKEEYTMTFAMDKAVYKKIMNLLSSKAFGASPEYMRDFLKAFCEDHDSCRVCPLKECGSDLGSSFDSMSDEEIEKYYKIAIRCNT